MDLFKTVLDKMSQEVHDAIILNGDFIGHDHAAELESEGIKKWRENLPIMQSAFDAMRE